MSGVKVKRRKSLDIKCPVCGGKELTRVFCYNKPPAGECEYGFSNEQSYKRWFFRCDSCGHFAAKHDIELQELYEGDYVDSLYGDQQGIKNSFDRILSLAPSESDNYGRVMRVNSFFKQSGKVLDIGSGLCVFLHGMKQVGWGGTALDPDERAVKHARETAGIKAIQADFMKVDRNIGRFDLVTFNKVLEHMIDPVKMLTKVQDNIKKTGLVYVEVPDGETAAREGADRQEFYVEHWHAFSAASLALLMQTAGFSVLKLERLHEPSGKYTMWAMGYSATQ